MLASLIIPRPLLLAPSYQLIYRFGLLDSFTGLILPGIAPAFRVFLVNLDNSIANMAHSGRPGTRGTPRGAHRV
jgi:ABC-type glycerol-3-phosphate transport system permease component